MEIQSIFARCTRCDFSQQKEVINLNKTISKKFNFDERQATSFSPYLSSPHIHQKKIIAESYNMSVMHVFDLTHSIQNIVTSTCAFNKDTSPQKRAIVDKHGIKIQVHQYIPGKFAAVLIICDVVSVKD